MPIIVSLQDESIEMFMFFASLDLLVDPYNDFIQFPYSFAVLLLLLPFTFLFYFPQNIRKNINNISYISSNGTFYCLIFEFLWGKIGKVDIREVKNFSDFNNFQEFLISFGF